MLTAEQKQQLLTKAVTEDAFRAALLEDPTATASAALGLTLPADYQLCVLESEPQQVLLVVPPYPADCAADASVTTLLECFRQGLRELPAVEATQQRVIDGHATLVAKAWHDPAFKRALLQDAKAVTEQEFGTALPADITLRTVAEDARTQYLVLPPALNDMDLTDEQLEQVAGGELFGLGFAAVMLIAFGIPAAVSVAGGVAAGVDAGVKSGW